jgi:hypothetical protein
MLAIPITLVSARDGRTYVHQTVVISNDGTGDEAVGNYGYKIFPKGKGGKINMEGKPIKEGTITGFPRKSKLAVDLLARVLQDAGRG